MPDILALEIDTTGLPDGWYLDAIPLIAPNYWLAVYDGPGWNIIELRAESPREVARLAWAVDRALRAAADAERIDTAVEKKSG